GLLRSWLCVRSSLFVRVGSCDAGLRSRFIRSERQLDPQSQLLQSTATIRSATAELQLQSTTISGAVSATTATELQLRSTAVSAAAVSAAAQLRSQSAPGLQPI